MGDNQVDEVKQKIDITEVIGERVVLKRAGRNLKGLCPFHGEKTPSFFVSPEMQMYKCFGCGAAGDVFSFLEAYEGMTFPEALEAAAKKAGVVLTKSYQNSEDRQRTRLLEAIHLAGEMYHYLLTKHRAGSKALAYLKERGVSKETINTYRLGYAPDQWRALSDFLLKKKGYTEKELVLAGLAVKHPTGRIYDRFRGRVMFPQMRANGTEVGLAGRLLGQNEKEAKYINSPETQLYHKSEVLYGLYQARGAIKKANRAVVVEGEFDVLSSVQAFVPETVAIKGSALTREQAILLKRLTNNVILALDADAAGQEAMVRAIEVAEPLGLTLAVVPVIGGKDPDEMAKADPKAWRAAVGKPQSVYAFYIDLALRRFGTESGAGQKQVTQMVLPVINRIENKVEQAFYIKKLALALGVSSATVEAEMSRLAVPKEEKNREPRTERAKITGRRERLERYVLGVGLHLGKEATQFFEGIPPEWVGETYLRTMLKDWQAGKETGPERQAAARELYATDQAWFTMKPEEIAQIAKKTRRELGLVAVREEIEEVSRELGQTEDEAELSRQRLKLNQLKREWQELALDKAG